MADENLKPTVGQPETVTPQDIPSQESQIAGPVDSSASGQMSQATQNTIQNAKPVSQDQPQPVTNQSVNVIAAHPRASIFHAIMSTLGGGDKTQYSVDPETGTISQSRVPQSTGDLAKSVVAGALTGLFAGAGEKGPGSELRAFQAGGQAVMQQRQLQDAQQKQQEQQSYENQQKQLVQKAQIFEANSRTALNIQQAEKLGEDMAQGYIKNMAPIYQTAKDEGRVVKDNVSQQDALAMMKSGDLNPGEDQFIATGWQPHINPDGTPGQGGEITGAIIKDGPFNPADHPDFPIDKAVQYGFLSGKGLAPGATIKTSVANQLAQKVQVVDNARAEMKQVHDKLGTAADSMPNFDDAIKTPGMAQALSRFQSYIGAAKNFDPAVAINLMAKEKQDPKTGAMMQNPDAKYIPLVYKAFGGQDVIEKYEKKIAPKAEILDENKALTIKSDPDATPEQKKQAQDFLDARAAQAGAQTYAAKTAEGNVEEAFQEKQNQMLKVPENFKLPDNVQSLSESEMKKVLQDQGVKIPDNFSALYAIAHGRSKLSTLPQKTYKGRSDITTQNGLSYINSFLKPDYQESDFDATQMFNKELNSSRTGTAGGTLLSAGTASQHLGLLNEAGTALKNNNLPALNNIANRLGLATGKSAPVVFSAIAEVVNQEVGKTVAGGAAHEAELAQLRDNLNRDQSPKQIQGVIRGYLNLMAGRMNEINDRSMQLLGRPIKVSPTTSKLFKDYGIEAEWLGGQKGSKEQNEKTWTPPSGAPSASGVPDGKVLKMNGQVVAIAKGGQWQQPQ